ncbi:MAG: bifunctional hydroxymethylpyrimidine kinase/phosphomethylpyrimidine kinase [Pseudomonadota bacterium]
MAIPSALTIAASDSCGADGLQADLRTFSALKVHGASVVTVVTAQNTEQVTAAEFMPPALIEAQIRAVFDDMALAAIKIGALGNVETIETVANTLNDVIDEEKPIPIVADPVMTNHAGDLLVDREVIDSWKQNIMPMATVITPNLAEAALLTDRERPGTLGDLMEIGETLVELGVQEVLVSGGQGKAENSIDILVSSIRPPVQLRAERMTRENMRGLSSTLTAAIAAHIAHEIAPYEAIQVSKVFLSGAIDTADTFSIGSGPGPIHQLNRLWESRQKSS